MAKELALDHSCDDDLFLLELFNDDMELDNQIISPVSDVNYAQGLQFQEALMASLINSPNPGNAASSVAESESGTSKQQPQEAEDVIKEVGQSSLSFCEICAERKENEQMFSTEGCNHFFCNDCISKHVETKVTESVHVVKCPAEDCKAVLELDSCTSLITKDTLAKWDEVLCRSLIPDSQKFYCPYGNCSAMLLRDTDEVIRESECPECRRLFCAECGVPWHSGVECEEYQKLDKDERGREDTMLMELAQQKEWKRCPRCRFYVEKTEGCLHMTCRCKFEFCYACGATWSSTHGCCR